MFENDLIIFEFRFIYDYLPKKRIIYNFMSWIDYKCFYYIVNHKRINKRISKKIRKVKRTICYHLQFLFETEYI